MQNGFFKTFDGTKLFCSVEGSGPPMLFLYGLVCSKMHWQYQLEHFKKTHTVIWCDYRGHHNSAIPSDISSLTIENMARDYEVLFDELKITQPVIVIGHSIGVSVALELYRRAPKRIKALVLSNGCARAPLESILKTNLSQFVHPMLYSIYRLAPKVANMLWASQGSNKIAHWLIGYLGFNPNLAKSKDIETYVRMLSKLDMLVFLELLKNYEKYDATAWLHRIGVPTLLISGDADLITPREAQEVMHQLIPGSRLEIVRNGSHCPQIDIPDLINVVLERFLADLQPSTAPDATASGASRDPAARAPLDLR